MLDLVRTSLHRVITTPKGDGLLPVRLPKDLARRFNMMLGEPICSSAELERRRTAATRLAELRRGGRSAAKDTSKDAASTSTNRVAAPVMVYFEKDRNTRLLARIQETLEARGITFTLLDVAGDSGTKDFVMREARCKEDELPIVFVASTAVGGYNDLVEWDVSGKLAKAVYPNS